MNQHYRPEEKRFHNQIKRWAINVLKLQRFRSKDDSHTCPLTLLTSFQTTHHHISSKKQHGNNKKRKTQRLTLYMEVKGSRMTQELTLGAKAVKQNLIDPHCTTLGINSWRLILSNLTTEMYMLQIYQRCLDHIYTGKTFLHVNCLKHIFIQ